MTKDEIIAMARKANLPACLATHPVALGRFADLAQQESTRKAVQACVDRLITGGQPAAAWILRHHFGLNHPGAVNEGSKP